MTRLDLIWDWYLRYHEMPDCPKKRAMQAVTYALSYGASFRMARHIYLQTLHRRLTRP